jgi:hypothetical protein
MKIIDDTIVIQEVIEAQVSCAKHLILGATGMAGIRDEEVKFSEHQSKR